MGLLDQVIGGVLGQVLGGQHGHERGGGGGSPGGMGGAMSPIVQAVLMLLLQKGMSGGFGDIFGGGQAGSRQAPQQMPHDGDLGGFGQDRGSYRGSDGPGGGGEFGDLSGMLDGPGGASANPPGHDSGAGPYSGLDREPADAYGGLDDLIGRFQRGGLGDVMESWIGGGQNRPVQPNQLGDVLGPQTVDALQSQTGLDRNTLLSQLSQVLPGIIDGLTPQGRKPGPEEIRHW